MPKREEAHLKPHAAPASTPVGRLRLLSRNHRETSSGNFGSMRQPCHARVLDWPCSCGEVVNARRHFRRRQITGAGGVSGAVIGPLARMAVTIPTARSLKLSPG